MLSTIHCVCVADIQTLVRRNENKYHLDQLPLWASFSSQTVIKSSVLRKKNIKKKINELSGSSLHLFIYSGSVSSSLTLCRGNSQTGTEEYEKHSSSQETGPHAITLLLNCPYLIAELTGLTQVHCKQCHRP